MLKWIPLRISLNHWISELRTLTDNYHFSHENLRPIREQCLAQGHRGSSRTRWNRRIRIPNSGFQNFLTINHWMQYFFHCNPVSYTQASETKFWKMIPTLPMCDMLWSILFHLLLKNNSLKESWYMLSDGFRLQEWRLTAKNSRRVVCREEIWNWSCYEQWNELWSVAQKGGRENAV